MKKTKSVYIIKIFFSYIEEKQKLRLVKFNKRLQKNLDISIINYKYLAGIYRIYGPNGSGKEYWCFNDKLRYKGEFLNAKKHGKGKEYNWFGILIYNGDYSNGIWHGKGKEYDIFDKFYFEGEFKNGEKNRKGKEYSKSGKLRFEGEYINNKRISGTFYGRAGKIISTLNNNVNGVGKEYDGGIRLIFEGEYLNGKRNGKGKNLVDMVN